MTSYGKNIETSLKVCYANVEKITFEKKSKKCAFFLDICFLNFYIGKKWEKVDKSGETWTFVGFRGVSADHVSRSAAS